MFMINLWSVLPIALDTFGQYNIFIYKDLCKYKDFVTIEISQAVGLNRNSSRKGSTF